MDMRTLGILAACLALPASAINRGRAPRWAPARETGRAELVEKSATGVSPVPTSRPELAAVDLFRRADDYSLPDDYCGWYNDFKSASWTCDRISASCINSGSHRGCCVGTGSSCSSTFWTTCIPSSSVTDTTPCSAGTLCCDADYPVCGTNLFSSSDSPSDTFTLLGCYTAGFDTTYQMQDFPPFTSTIPATTQSESESHTASHSTTDPTPDPTSPKPSQTDSSGPKKKSVQVGAIVGGVIGGVALIGLIALGVLYLYRRRLRDSSAPAPGPGGELPPNQSYPQDPGMQYQQLPMDQAPPGQQLYPPQAGAPSMYDPRFSYVETYPGKAGGYATTTATGSPPLHQSPGQPTTAGLASTPSPNPSTMAGSVSPGQNQGQFAAMEAPATNPVGVGDNRAELSG